MTGPGTPVAAVPSAQTGIERIAHAFSRHGKQAALMPYLMGGYPTLEDSLRIGQACVHSGADIIELGMPYSDPLADGPVIHAAGTHALAAGANVTGVLEVARALSPTIPVVLMCYANMVLAPGVEAFVERLAQTGACGLIVPDLPLEGGAPRGWRSRPEAGEPGPSPFPVKRRPTSRAPRSSQSDESQQALAACDARGLALVPLVAPTTSPERLARIGSQARGFLYTVSLVGTTGERTALSERFAEVIAGAKAATSAPIALGFGISTPAQAAQAAQAGADGVIVGTRLVRAAGESEDPAGAVGALVAELAAGLAL
jgi:tryptophan synthase alpha chain